MKSQKLRLLSLVIAIVCTFTVTAGAADFRASDQIGKYDIDATCTGGGELAILFSVEGTGRMTSLGAEEIVIYEKLNDYWITVGYFGKDDSGMMDADTNIYTNVMYFSGEENTEYKISVTIFAEDSNGSDSRTSVVYVDT